MLEKQIEGKIRDFAKSYKWKVFKFSSPSNAGVADRLLIRNGVTLFIEVKQEGKRPTALQKKFLRDMRLERTLAWWADSLEDVKDILSATNPKMCRDANSTWGINDKDLKA